MDTVLDEYTTDQPYTVTAQYPGQCYTGRYDRLTDAMRDYAAEIEGFVAMMGRPADRLLNVIGHVNGSIRAIGAMHAWDSGHAVAYTFA